MEGRGFLTMSAIAGAICWAEESMKEIDKLGRLGRLSLDIFDLARGIHPQMGFSLRPVLFESVLPPTVVGLGSVIYRTL